MEDMKSALNKSGIQTRNRDKNSNNGGGGGRKKKVTHNYSLPKGYLKDGYFNHHKDEKDTVKDEFILGAVELANGFKSDNVTYGQMRKFFEAVRNVQYSVNKGTYKFNGAKETLNRLVPLAQNSRSKGYVSEAFKEFIRINVNAVNSLDDLRAFDMHFEAIVGYLPDAK